MVARARKSISDPDSHLIGVRVIKKYPNRRLYDTLTSSYMTLGELKQLVIDSQEIVVNDAKSGEDITRSVLLQIILEEETCGVPMFSHSALVNIIRFYGQLMQGVLGSYIEQNMQSIMDLQEQMEDKNKPLSGEVWQKMMRMKAPVMQLLLQSYAQSSSAAYQRLQDQMSQQTAKLFEAMRIKSPK